MKINKKNIAEYIGYFSLALVCVLSLVLSFGLVELYQQPIVANAQIIDGVDYPSINVDDLDLLFSTQSTGGYIDVAGLYRFDTYVLGDSGSLNFVPFNTYYLVYDDADYHLTGTFVASDNIASFGSISFVSSFSLYSNFLSNKFILAFIAYDAINEEYSLFFLDEVGDFSQPASSNISIYSLPSSDSSDTPVTDNIISVIADGMSFGYSSLADGVAYTMENLFLDNGELSNFTILLVSILGIGVALGITKFVLRFIFSLGGMRKL